MLFTILINNIKYFEENRWKVSAEERQSYEEQLARLNAPEEDAKDHLLRVLQKDDQREKSDDEDENDSRFQRIPPVRISSEDRTADTRERSVAPRIVHSATEVNPPNDTSYTLFHVLVVRTFPVHLPQSPHR